MMIRQARSLSSVLVFGVAATAATLDCWVATAELGCCAALMAAAELDCCGAAMTLEVAAKEALELLDPFDVQTVKQRQRLSFILTLKACMTDCYQHVVVSHTCCSHFTICLYNVGVPFGVRVVIGVSPGFPVIFWISNIPFDWIMVLKNGCHILLLPKPFVTHATWARDSEMQVRSSHLFLNRPGNFTNPQLSFPCIDSPRVRNWEPARCIHGLRVMIPAIMGIEDED
ncbi:hypothetical protein M758_UG120700 [Ceratodon purpureus]|nr:hypothetical protein M758_UG120700 [Ceratodon purpureus]